MPHGVKSVTGARSPSPPTGARGCRVAHVKSQFRGCFALKQQELAGPPSAGKAWLKGEEGNLLQQNSGPGSHLAEAAIHTCTSTALAQAGEHLGPFSYRGAGNQVCNRQGLGSRALATSGEPKRQLLSTLAGRGEKRGVYSPLFWHLTLRHACLKAQALGHPYPDQHGKVPSWASRAWC